MVEQVDEKGQVVRLHPLFIEGKDKAPAGRFQQEIAVFDAFGYALARHDGADVIAGDERGERVGVDMGIDGHQAAAGSNPRGSLNTLCPTVMTANSSTIDRTAAIALMTSRTTATGALVQAGMPRLRAPPHKLKSA